MKIVGIAGSLRKNSFSGMLLSAASKLAPEGVEFEILDISQFPLYNQDEDANMPEVVKAVKAKIEAADAVVIVIFAPGISAPEGSATCPRAVTATGEAADRAVPPPPGALACADICTTHEKPINPKSKERERPEHHNCMNYRITVVQLRMV